MQKELQIRVYSIGQAKATLSKLVKEAAAGKDIIIARGNVPVARLVPIKYPNRRPGTLKGKLKIKPGAFDPLSADEFKIFGG